MGQGLLAEGGRKRERERQIARRLGDADPADSRREHVTERELQLCPLLEHGQEQGDTVRVDALHVAPRHGERRGADQRLQLDHQGALTLHGADDDRARCAVRTVAEEQRTGVGDASQPLLVHLEQPKLAGGAEAMLRGP